MIAKELDDVTAIDKWRAAGHAAEAQLAFYLRRTLADTPDIHVFNGLRFESLGDAAKLDHLILHPYGIIVVESKSVHARIKINERGEWLRLYKGHYQGMPSARLQAERQVLFLRRYLEPHSAQLLDDSRGKRPSLASLPIDLLGLRMLGVFERCREEVLRLEGEWLTLTDLPNDPDVWKSIQHGDTMGLFQIESPAQTRITVDVQPQSFLDLAHQVALIRPVLSRAAPFIPMSEGKRVSSL